MEIISYPGPSPGIKREHLTLNQTVPPVPARNRRIGEFLKELRLAEGRGTGIPKIQRKMQENGSPEARFDFDDERTYFRAILPVHPRYQALHALREAAHLWATGDKKQAIAHLQRAFRSLPSSGAIASQIIEYAFGLSDLDLARNVLTRFEKEPGGSEASQPYLTMARLLMDRDLTDEASGILKRIPQVRTARESTEAAILKKRAGDLEGAHRLFAEAYAINSNDPQIIQEFAQTKIRLAKKLRERRDLGVKKRLSREAAELLRKAIHLSDDLVRKAWCWYDLAKVLDLLREPTSEVEAAFLQALALLPGEPRFKSGYQEWKRRANANQRK